MLELKLTNEQQVASRTAFDLLCITILLDKNRSVKLQYSGFHSQMLYRSWQAIFISGIQSVAFCGAFGMICG